MASAVRALGRDAFVSSAPPVKRDGKAEKADDQGSIAKDVAKIQVWPGSDAPAVADATDPRLANAGMSAKILTFIDNHFAHPVAEAGRLITRTVGPGMFWFSGLANTYFLAKNWSDPRFTAPMRATLIAGTGATVAAATTATWAALPVRGALTANRFAGLFGGLAGGIFSAANAWITLKDRKSTRVQKTFATAGFLTGVAGSTFGVMAAFLPAGAALGPLGLGAWGLIFGLVSTATALGQLFLGKNKWLNGALGKVTSWGKKAWEGMKSVF